MYTSNACVRGSPMVPLVGNIFTICTNFNLITNGKEISATVKMLIPLVQMLQLLPTDSTTGRHELFIKTSDSDSYFVNATEKKLQLKLN